MAILIEILILIVFSHLDRSLTRAGDSVLTTLVSRHASDAWQCNVRQCCTIFREGAYHLHTSSLKFSAKPGASKCLLWIFENIVKHHLHVWLRGGGSWCHLNKQLNTSWHRIEIYRVFARAWRPVRASGGWFVSLARIWLCQMATVDTYF